MYKCEKCGLPFEHPFVRKYTDKSVDCKATFYEPICPHCGDDNIGDANSCPGCDGFKFRDEILCKDCRKSLLDRVIAFADELTAEQEEQINDWMDGDVIENRGKWS